MNNFFFVIFLLSILLSIFFSVQAFNSALKRHKSKSRRQFIFTVISILVLIGSFIAYMST